MRSSGDVKHMAWVFVKILSTLVVCSAGFVVTFTLMQRMRRVVPRDRLCNLPFAILCSLVGVILSVITVIVVLRKTLTRTFETLNPVVKFLTLVVPILMATPQWVNIFGSDGTGCGAAPS